MTGPGTAADAIAERRHPVEHLVHVGHDIVSVDDDALVAWRAERHVEDGSVLGDVDLLAGEHRVDPRTQSRRFRQPHQEADGLVGDAVLRVVEVETRGFEREPFATTGILGEQVTEMDIGDDPVMCLEGLPLGSRVPARHRSRTAFPPVSANPHMRRALGASRTDRG